MLLGLSGSPIDSNRIANPGFEKGSTAWHFWARAADSGKVSLWTSDCRGGTSCLEIDHQGSQDWAQWPDFGKTIFHVGEVWRWSLWVRYDTLRGEGELGFVTKDSSGSVIEWVASPTALPIVAKNWVQVTARIAIAKGCTSLQPRLTGFGIDSIRLDDAEFALESSGTNFGAPLQLQNDSVELSLDPTDLSMRLRARDGSDSVWMQGLGVFHFDSAQKQADTLVVLTHHLSERWKARLRVWLLGGSVRMALEADSASVLPGEFPFPGPIATRTGQWIAIPRGTGLAWPVDGPLSTQWTYTSAQFWEWQVSQALTGATDGKTGFVTSVDQPSDARLELKKVGNGTSYPVVWQVPSKGVFGHTRSAVVALLKTGGFAEMAQRHRQRLEELGRVKNWTRKILENPNVDKLRGAIDWWVYGTFSSNTFDTLRWMGQEQALLHWDAWRTSEIDSLSSHGWLVSVYDNWADASPNDTSPNGRENPSGAVIQSDGSTMKGWLSKNSDGSTTQALEICSARHPHLARANLELDLAKVKRNARFIDVELAMNLQECWSKVHPVDRAHDLSNRLLALSVVKDSFRLVTGSEQTRDVAHGLVDYGEGPMSIASVADAGYDWNTPEPPESAMDSLSMDPTYRIPLLPLTDHDAFSPTWYTGDGQSKVPARWDDKDAWNMLYATMPLVSPVDRKMWDSLRVRYLRTINAVGAFLSRTQFEPMTDFDRLSLDGKVQRTRFANGWSVTANFDTRTRTEAGTTLPAKGYLAARSQERIERSFLDGATRTRVRLADRWFLDPEGSVATLDGIRTGGSVFVKHLDDTTLALSLVGDQDHIDLNPTALPWPASSLRATLRFGTPAAINLTPLDSLWVRLSASTTKFFLLHGDFGHYSDLVSGHHPISSATVHPSSPGWKLNWTQEESAPAQLRVFSADGRLLFHRFVDGKPGFQTLELPAFAKSVWLRLTVQGLTRTLALPPL